MSSLIRDCDVSLSGLSNYRDRNYAYLKGPYDPNIKIVEAPEKCMN